MRMRIVKKKRPLAGREHRYHPLQHGSSPAADPPGCPAGGDRATVSIHRLASRLKGERHVTFVLVRLGACTSSDPCWWTLRRPPDGTFVRRLCGGNAGLSEVESRRLRH